MAYPGTIVSGTEPEGRSEEWPITFRAQVYHLVSETRAFPAHLLLRNCKRQSISIQAMQHTGQTATYTPKQIQTESERCSRGCNSLFVELVEVFHQGPQHCLQCTIFHIHSRRDDSHEQPGAERMPQYIFRVFG